MNQIIIFFVFDPNGFGVNLKLNIQVANIVLFYEHNYHLLIYFLILISFS